MSEIGTRSLNWDVIVAPAIPVVTDDLPPGIKQRIFSPVSATLIFGKRDAVLVDALLTIDHAVSLVNWIAASGKSRPRSMPRTATATIFSALVRYWSDSRMRALLQGRR